MTILIKNARFGDSATDVLIRDGRFDSIGPGIDAAADTVLDGSGKAVLPSFHNTHTHAAMTLLRGYADDMELHTWLSEHIWPFEAGLTEEDIYWGARLACLEMIRSGTTFFTDMYWHWRGTARAVEEMGLRATLCAAFFDFGDTARAETMKSQVMELHAASGSFSDRIQFALGPHAIYTVSAESLHWTAEYAAGHGLRIHMHLSETLKEVEECQAEHGLRPVEYLHSLGLLGPHLSLAHAVWLNEAEMELLARYGVRVAHCPVSNMKLCSGRFSMADMRRHGVPVALGTDGCASNNSLDMFGEMKAASLLAKITSMDPAIFPAREALEAATVEGARMFGLESGRIAVGAPADCVLVDLNRPCMTPGHHLESNLVYSATGACVDTVICAGRILMRGGVVDGEEEILTRARETAARLAAAARSGGGACC